MQQNNNFTKNINSINKIAKIYLLHPKNQENFTVMEKISIQNQQTIHKRSFPSIVHEKERASNPKRAKISEVAPHNGEK
jgi:hypothetical protein